MFYSAFIRSQGLRIRTLVALALLGIPAGTYSFTVRGTYTHQDIRDAGSFFKLIGSVLIVKSILGPKPQNAFDYLMTCVTLVSGGLLVHSGQGLQRIAGTSQGRSQNAE